MLMKCMKVEIKFTTEEKTLKDGRAQEKLLEKMAKQFLSSMVLRTVVYILVK